MHQTKNNDYSILYQQISTLLENKTILNGTFDEENKQRLLELINTDKISYLFEDLPIEADEGTLICSHINLGNKSIVHITDMPDENKIIYIVNIEVFVDAKDEEEGYYYWEDSAELTIDYHFEDDAFYLQQLCGFVGSWIYEDRAVQL